MKAIKCTGYGPPDMLKLTDVEKPVPGDNDVLIRIYTSTVTKGDCELRSLTLPLWTRIPMRIFMGYTRPRNFITGMEFAGEIESVGKHVTAYKKGDQVFASSGMSMGANAEYKCCPAKSPLAIKPSEVSFEDAATIPVGGINALHFLRKTKIQPGQKVLVIGAGGCIGTYGVQLAKFYGAEVTAVDRASKLDMLRSIGADKVIDYEREDFSANSMKYDVIFDLVYESSFSKCLRALKDNGVYLMANTGPLRMFRGLWVSCWTRKKIFFALAEETIADLSHLAELIATGKLKPVIDKIYPLEQTAAAHAYVDEGNKKGCIVIHNK